MPAAPLAPVRAAPRVAVGQLPGCEVTGGVGGAVVATDVAGGVMEVVVEAVEVLVATVVVVVEVLVELPEAAGWDDPQALNPSAALRTRAADERVVVLRFM